MANIASQQPIRFQIDAALSDLSGLLTHPGVDCSNVDFVDGIAVSGTEPVGTQRAAAFQVDGTWNKISPDGMLSALPTQSLTADSLLAEGNTAAELNALSTIPAFVGKQIPVAIALYAEDPEGDMPTCKLAVKARNNTEQTSTEELSSVFQIGDGAQIVSLAATTLVTGDSVATVTARITRSDGTVSGWAALNSFAGQYATAVQFRAALSVSAIGGADSARVNSANIVYRAGGIVSGVGVSSIYSITKDWQDLQEQCRALLEHLALKDAQIRPYAAFRAQPVKVVGEAVGIGSNVLASYDLAHTDGVDRDSLRLYFDGVRQYTGYEVNTAIGRVTCTAPRGVVVSVDYEYGWDLEVWHELERQRVLVGFDYDTSEYKYVLPLEVDPGSVCALRIDLITTAGHVDEEALGSGIGTIRTYPLEHIVRDGALTVYADGVELPNAEWILTADAKGVRIAAPLGSQLTAAYDWISETPTLYKFVGVFAE